ncbi:hypothetical protein PoB_001572000 [Plakobranchus ocellatus]|uniref:Secreted protein n=1 Tax=Plakobranchus ocellatus TaxID=259542 RepID=A0AAV3Z3L8_9GAST|nr:hypothetical protein PoB_001572000 [Plakobranchus ocellatus]
MAIRSCAVYGLAIRGRACSTAECWSVLTLCLLRVAPNDLRLKQNLTGEDKVLACVLGGLMDVRCLWSVSSATMELDQRLVS